MVLPSLLQVLFDSMSDLQNVCLGWDRGYPFSMVIAAYSALGTFALGAHCCPAAEKSWCFASAAQHTWQAALRPDCCVMRCRICRSSAQQQLVSAPAEMLITAFFKRRMGTKTQAACPTPSQVG